jgi:hypothetical protein
MTKTKTSRKLRARFRPDATHFEKVLDKFQEEHPYPRWKCEVWMDQLLICRMRSREERRYGWQVIYHVTDCGTHDYEELKTLGDRELDKVVAEEGGSHLGTGFFGNDMPEHFREQIQETDMRAVLINGEEICFDDEKTTRIMEVVSSCAKQHRRVTILYTKTNKTVVKRDIAPYSLEGDLLYATDQRDGNKQIKSYKIYSIKSAKKSNKKFKPQWEIKL